MMYIYCDRPSRSARALSRLFNQSRNIDKDEPLYRLRPKAYYNTPATVINWGCTVPWHLYGPTKIINPPEAVRKATDKLLFFQAMEGTGLTPRFYTTSAEASEAIENGKVIVCRTVLNGHSGAGIVISSRVEDIAPAKLYVDYIRKETEWRVHVFNGEVIDVQRKARNLAIPNEAVDWQVRNHDNGFIYMRGDSLELYGIAYLDKIMDPAMTTVKHLGLDFGAVDILVTKGGKVYVLEVNTAPGLEGTTLDNYVKVIRNIV